MTPQDISDEEVFRFVLHQIDTVPQLEALLLLWRKRPQRFTEQDLAAQLFVDANTVTEITNYLRRRELIAADSNSPPTYWYEGKTEYMDTLIEALSDTYRRELISISKLIHSKTSSPARDFAQAFKFTRDREQ